MSEQAVKYQESIDVTGDKKKISFSVSEFKTKLNNVVRPNIFRVKFLSIPSIMEKADYSISGDLENFEFRCERAELPGKSIATIDDISAGPTLKLPYDVTYNDIQLTLICSEDMFERYFFENWIDQTIANRGQYGGMIRYYDEFASDSKLQVSQCNSSGENLVTYVLYDVFPIQLSPMTLAWEETNTYQRFTVTLSYRNHMIK